MYHDIRENVKREVDRGWMDSFADRHQILSLCRSEMFLSVLLLALCGYDEEQGPKDRRHECHYDGSDPWHG